MLLLRRRIAGALAKVRSSIPNGGALPAGVWQRRHNGVITLLWLHVPAIAAYARVRGVSTGHGVVEAALIAVLATAATLLHRHPRAASVASTLGLLTSSAVLVHLSGGLIEMHFHFFVIVGVITLYQDWWPFLTAIGYVVFQHGLAGALLPSAVYNHTEAIDHPWQWAAVHGGFVLAMSAVGIVSWRQNELLLEDAEHRESDLAHAKDELLDTLGLLTATLDSTADGIQVVDLSGRVTSSNRRFVDMWQIPAAVLVGEDDTTALAAMVGQVANPSAFLRRVSEIYAATEGESYDSIELLDGRVIERFSRPQRLDGVVVGRVWSFGDITDRTRLEAELAHLAFHDSLTGLANQALFRDRVTHALARNQRGQLPMAVLFLDLDNFKTVNDSMGHRAGDELLIAVSRRLEADLRPSDTGARLGGDEFAILLEDLDSVEAAADVAARIVAGLRPAFRIGGKSIVVTASIGVAFAEPGISADQLLRNADLAMYTAKASGRDRVDHYRPAMHTAAVDRLELEADLRVAVDRGEMSVQYQPIVELASGRTLGFEALVRWEHPERGVVPPLSFIPLAEQTGLIDAIGSFVFAAAVTEARRWELAGQAVSMAVNVSACQLTAGDLVGRVRNLLGARGLTPSLLTIELTESAMMHDTEATLACLHGLKALGVTLAIDDFGTGYSSLSYLRRFPVDILKIDRSFLLGIETEPTDRALAQSIIRMARTLGMTSVAEGIESSSQALVLRSLGCDRAQGFHIARPLTPAGVADWMTTKSHVAVVDHVVSADTQQLSLTTG